MTDIAGEYAAALFELAGEKQSYQQYFEGLEMLRDSFDKNPEYIDFLNCPSISAQTRQQAVFKAFSGKVPDEVLTFLVLLIKKRHMRRFNDCVEQYDALLKASQHISDATVTSCGELDDAQKKRLEEKLCKICGNAVNVRYLTDASLVGGVKVEFDGKVIDGSLHHRLKQIKDVISK